MSDYIVDDVLGTPEPAPEPAVEETVPVKAEDAPAPETQEEGGDEGEDGEGSEEAKHKKNRTQRMREKIARQAEALEQANQRLAALEQRAAPQRQPVADEAPPKMDDPRFETLEQFTQALAQYEARQAVRAYQAEQEARSVRDSEMKAQEAWKAQCAKVAETKPDWDEKIEDFSYFAGQVGNAAPAVAQAVSLAIRESDIGPELVYYLGGKPEEMKRFAEMSPFAAVREIGRLEERLRAKPGNTKQVSGAPPPINPAKAGATVKPKTGNYIIY